MEDRRLQVFLGTDALKVAWESGSSYLEEILRECPLTHMLSINVSVGRNKVVPRVMSFLVLGEGRTFYMPKNTHTSLVCLQELSMIEQQNIGTTRTSLLASLPKTYEPQSVEAKWYRFWEEGDYFKPRPNPERKPFVISMPPPNVTGALHLGHAITATS